MTEIQRVGNSLVLAASYCACSSVSVHADGVARRACRVSTSEWDISSGINLPGSNRVRSFRFALRREWYLIPDRTVCPPSAARHTTTRARDQHTRAQAYSCIAHASSLSRDSFGKRIALSKRATRCARYSRASRVAARKAINTSRWWTRIAGTVLYQAWLPIGSVRRL